MYNWKTELSEIRIDLNSLDCCINFRKRDEKWKENMHELHCLPQPKGDNILCRYRFSSKPYFWSLSLSFTII